MCCIYVIFFVCESLSYTGRWCARCENCIILIGLDNHIILTSVFVYSDNFRYFKNVVYDVQFTLFRLNLTLSSEIRTVYTIYVCKYAILCIVCHLFFVLNSQFWFKYPSPTPPCPCALSLLICSFTNRTERQIDRQAGLYCVVAKVCFL